MKQDSEEKGLPVIDEFALNRFYNAGAKACLLAGAGKLSLNNQQSP